MSVKSFLIALIENGKVRVDRPREEAAREVLGAEDVLRQMDSHARLEAPGEPPRLSVGAAVWGALTLYRGAQLLVHRDAEADYVRKALAAPCPEKASPEAAWSVDLALRYLPDLLSLSRGVAEDDPLVTELARIARDWPLSSVGARGVEARDLSAILDHPSLRRIYLDRVVERRDLSRLGPPRVDEGVRETLGAYPELWPEAADRLGLVLKETR
ncbi:MAG: hypothetical protein AAB434_06515 [Planctomycetota bacterium]